MKIDNNSAQHDRTKHIEVDYHFIREGVLSKKICLSSHQSAIARCPNNGLVKAQFKCILSKLSMIGICPKFEGV